MSSQTLGQVDRPLLYVCIFLLLAGLLILASSSMVISQQKYGTPFYYLTHQMITGVATGIAGLLIIQRVNYRRWKKLSLPFIFLSLVLLGLVFVPKIGISAGGASRWINLKIFSFQPSEIAKIAFIIYLASWLDTRKEEVKSIPYGFIPFGIMLSIISIFLIMQPDIGTLGLILITAGVMYFLGGGKISQILTLLLFGISIGYFVIQLAPYRLNRILVFLNPNIDPLGIGYQINQALIGIGSGGIFGTGFGQSIQKYNYLPEPITDSIFAIFAEEMGIIGSTALIAAFAFLLWRGFWIAKKAPDTFGTLLAAGIIINIIFQAFINMAAISSLLPLTGMPLPFVSYGGTSLAVTLASIGILMNISRHIQVNRKIV